MPSLGTILLYGITAAAAYVLRFTLVLFPLLRSEAHTSLSFRSSEFAGFRYWSLFVCFVTRSLLRRIPFFAPPPIREYVSTADEDKGHSSTIPGPRISLEIPFHCTAADIIRYNRAAKTVGIDTSTHPLHLMLFLSAATEPAMLLLLSKANCPIDPVGAVNVRNRFELVDRALLEEKLKEAINTDLEGDGNDKDVQDQEWKLVARLDPNVKKVKKGWEVMVIIELVTNSETVLYRQSFTFLQFAKHKNPIIADSKWSDEEGKEGETSQVGVVNMTNKDPGSWAELSKDYNPIHFSTLVAKAFGFRTKIAHGNHVLAKGLAKIPNTTEVKEITTMEVEFRRPVFVPCELEVGQGDGEVALGIKGKVHVVARFGRTRE